MNRVRKAGPLVPQLPRKSLTLLCVCFYQCVSVSVGKSLRRKACKIDHLQNGITKQGLIGRKILNTPITGERLLYAFSETVLCKEQWVWGQMTSGSSSDFATRNKHVASLLLSRIQFLICLMKSWVGCMAQFFPKEVEAYLWGLWDVCAAYACTPFVSPSDCL